MCPSNQPVLQDVVLSASRHLMYNITFQHFSRKYYKFFNFQDFFQNFQIPGFFQDILKFQNTVGTLINRIARGQNHQKCLNKISDFLDKI